MKKYLTTFILSMVSLNLLAQVYRIKNIYRYENVPQEVLSNIDKMGMDESVFLTEWEGRYLNAVGGISEDDFNLGKSKVAFFEGKLGSIRSDKKTYFARERECLKTNVDSLVPYFSALYIFNDAQKAENGGYDAAVVYRSKASLSIKKVIRQLKREHKKATRSKDKAISERFSY